MDQRAAFDATIALALSRNMSLEPDSSLGLSHLLDMHFRITPEFSEAKLGRWLGWAQAALVHQGAATLDQMKRINMRFADVPPVAVPTTGKELDPTPQVENMVAVILTELRRQYDDPDNHMGPYTQGIEHPDDVIVDGHVNLYELAEAVIGHDR